ncbi:MAG: hypothetical protein AAGO57_03840 [Pseudomonadota bacterium]
MKIVASRANGIFGSWVLRAAALLLASIAAVSSSAKADDYTNAILAHAQRFAPPGTVVDHGKIDHLAFPGQASGRLSVKGVYVAQTDLIKPNGRYPQLIAHLVSQGYSTDEIQVALHTFDDYPPYGNSYFEEAVVSEKRGTEISFRGELSYLETIDGITLRGALDFQRPFGRPSLTNDYYVVGTPAFQERVGEVASAIEVARLALRSGGQVGDGIVQQFQGAHIDMFPSILREAPWTLFEIVIPEGEQAGGASEYIALSRHSNDGTYKRTLSAQVNVVSGIKVGSKELREGTLLPLTLTFFLDKDQPDISGLMLRYEVLLAGKKILDQPSGGTKFLEHSGTSYQGTAKLDLYINNTIFGGLYVPHVIVLRQGQQS